MPTTAINNTISVVITLQKMIMPKANSYRAPWIALLWSAMLPGLGHFYNKDYILGITLLFLEIGVNCMANLNQGIYYAFNGYFADACSVINYQWILFYPAIYAFSMWHAYNNAIDINADLEVVPPKQQRSRYTGAFIGFTLGLLFGTIWNYQLVIVVGLVEGVVGLVAGYYIEKYLTQNI